MSDLRTAAQQALEALEELNGWQSLAPPLASQAAKQAAINLRAALEQPEPEPVAIVSSVTEPGQYGVKVKWLGGFPQIAMKLFTHPPRREWRGLTDELIDSVWPSPEGTNSIRAVAYAIEAALKERNG